MVEKTWAPYCEKMKEHLDQLSLVRLTQWQGADIAGAEHSAGPGGSGTVQAFTADKIEKAAIARIMAGDAVQYGICTIFPAEGFDLPIYFSRWEERADSISILVDLVPTVDSLVDEPYRKKYIETLGPLWDKYSNLPGMAPEENDAVRAVCSIVYTAAVIPIEREGMRLAALAPHTEYLKKYLEFHQSAVPVEDPQKLQEIKRKIAAVKATLRDYFKGALAGPVGQGLGAGLSEQLSDILL
ncbi:MAG: hypothetical protein JW832_08380 [Deltaproteobacteria bacterium]|nr:hypothetical protein [Deltaproteobacteria bacterium]